METTNQPPPDLEAKIEEAKARQEQLQHEIDEQQQQKIQLQDRIERHSSNDKAASNGTATPPKAPAALRRPSSGPGIADAILENPTATPTDSLANKVIVKWDSKAKAHDKESIERIFAEVGAVEILGDVLRFQVCLQLFLTILDAPFATFFYARCPLQPLP